MGAILCLLVISLSESLSSADAEQDSRHISSRWSLIYLRSQRILDAYKGKVKYFTTENGFEFCQFWCVI